MNIIGLISLIALIGLFLFNLWQLLYLKKDDAKDSIGFHKWRLGLFVLALSSLVFFIYFSNALTSVGAEQTITSDYGDVFTYKSNTYLEAFAYMPLVIALYTTQWLMFFIQLIQGFNFLGGRSRMKRLGE